MYTTLGSKGNVFNKSSRPTSTVDALRCIPLSRALKRRSGLSLCKGSRYTKLFPIYLNAEAVKLNDPIHSTG